MPCRGTSNIASDENVLLDAIFPWLHLYDHATLISFIDPLTSHEKFVFHLTNFPAWRHRHKCSTGFAFTISEHFSRFYALFTRRLSGKHEKWNISWLRQSVWLNYLAKETIFMAFHSHSASHWLELTWAWKLFDLWEGFEMFAVCFVLIRLWH